VTSTFSSLVLLCPVGFYFLLLSSYHFIPSTQTTIQRLEQALHFLLSLHLSPSS
jgi:hypothetical protein